MYQTSTSNFNPTNSKYLSISSYQEFPVIKFTRMKKEKPICFGNSDKTNFNAPNNNAGKTLNNLSTYYSPSSYPDLVLTNSINKNLFESKKDFLLSTVNKTKEESYYGFFPKGRILNAIKKTDVDNEKNEKSEKEKSREKYHFKNLEFEGNHKTKSNLNLNTTQISSFISPSNRININNNNNNLNYYNNNSTQHNPENSHLSSNNVNTNQNNQTYLHSINVTHNGFNATQTSGTYRNNISKFNHNYNKNFANYTNLSSYHKENRSQLNFNGEFKSVHGGVTNKMGKNPELINCAKKEKSPMSILNNCITSNNNFSKLQNHLNTSNDKNESNHHNSQREMEDLKNLKLRSSYNSGVFKSFNKFTKTQHSPNNQDINALNNKCNEKKKIINLTDFDQFEIHKENYMKMREEQLLKDTAYYIYDKLNTKKLKKFIFKEIPTNESFKEIIDKITRLVEIKRNNNEFISFEYILNMLREEIENNSITPLRMKNEDFMLPLVNKKSDHAALEFESALHEKNLFQRLKRSKNKSNTYNSVNGSNKYFTSSISEEVENYWQNRNGRNDESIATNLLNKDKLKLNGEKYIIKSKKTKLKSKKKEKSNSYYTDTSDYYESDSYLTNTQNSKGENKKRKRRRRLSEGEGAISENSFSENENNKSYMEKDLSDLERKRRRRRGGKDKYANLPKTSDMGSKVLGNLEVNLEKEIKFLNTQKNFFLKRFDSFLITQSSGFDGVSENMLRKTLSILDSYGKKRNEKKKDGLSGDKDAMASQLTDFEGIKAKENFENLNKKNNNYNNNSIHNNFVTLNSNQNNFSSKRISNFNNFNPKGIGNSGNKNGSGAASPAKSLRKKLNLKDSKRKKSEVNDGNKVNNNNNPPSRKGNSKNNNNNNSESNKNAESEIKLILLGTESADFVNTEDNLTTENNKENGLLDHLKADLLPEEEKTEGNSKPKKTRKRIIKQLKEGCAEGAEEYEEVEIEETDPDQDVNEGLENTEANEILPKDADVEQVDISNFKKFMMESLFSPPPVVDNNNANTDNGGNGDAGGKKKKKKRNAAIGDIIDEYSNETDYDDDSEEELEEYLETEEYLNTETGEIEVKRIKKTRKKKKQDEGEDGKEKGKKARKKKRDSKEAIFNPQLDMLLQMIQEEDNKKLVESPQSVRVKRVLKKRVLLLEPVNKLLISNEENNPEEEYEEVESDETTESEKNRRAEQLRLERERNEMMKKKINDAYILGINQNLNFLMSQGMSESDMARYQDLLEKIESLKNLDPGNYMRNIKMLLEEFKREEQEIHELKKIERRINGFKFDLAEDRDRVNLARETKLSSLKMRDRTFNTTVSELSKNVITQRKFTKMY